MRDGAVRISKGYLFFVSRRPPALAPPSREVEVVADPSRTRAGAGDAPRAGRRARAPPAAGRGPRSVARPRPRAGPQCTQPCRGTAHAPRAGPRGGRQRPTAGPRPRRRARDPGAGRAGHATGGGAPEVEVARGERAAERHRAADRKTPTRATASRLIHGGHAHDFMRGRCTHLNNGTHQNNDQICSLDGHQNANMAQANTPVVRHGPGGAVTADATAHNYNVSRRTAIIIYGLASSAGSTLPASCHAGISSHAEHHEAHIHHRA
jgi:hypothetical protein